MTQPILEPTMVDLLRMHERDVSRGIRCAFPGQIESYDVDKKTAQVHILLKRRMPNGDTASFPPLVDVPVLTFQGGGAYLQMPVGAGDQCLLVFIDRNMDSWFQTGGESVPPDDRSHDLSDAVAIVGLDSLASAQPAGPTDEGRIIAGAAKVRVKKDGSAASLVQGTAEVTAKGSKILAKNNTTDLLTALNGVLDVIGNLTVTDPISDALAVTPATTAAVANAKAVLANLLVSS